MNTTSQSQTDTSLGGATAATSTMRAVVQDRYGSSDTWKLSDIDRPEINDHEVVLHVRAAGLDRGTWHEMTGRPDLMRLIGFGLRAMRKLEAGTVRGKLSITI